MPIDRETPYEVNPQDNTCERCEMREATVYFQFPESLDRMELCEPCVLDVDKIEARWEQVKKLLDSLDAVSAELHHVSGSAVRKQLRMERGSLRIQIKAQLIGAFSETIG